MNIFQQPYPYSYRQGKLIRIAITLFVILYIFLVAFQPFNVVLSEHRFPFFITVFIQTLFSTCIFFTVLFVFNRLFLSERMERNWKVWQEVLLLATVLLLIGIGNYLVRNIIYDNPNNLSWQYFKEELIHTFLIGGLLMLLFTLTNTERLVRLHKKFAADIETESAKHDEQPTVTIETQLENENFNLNISQFLYAKADGNYVEFFLKNGESVTKLLHRMTLTQLETQLQHIQGILKTHRAFIVNTHLIQNVEGNAQGLQLSLDGISEKIPVSRSNISSFKGVMKR